MAEQMLKQAALSQMKVKDDLLDLKRINNQPIESAGSDSSHLDNYHLFSPLRTDKALATSTPITHFTSEASADMDRFQIRNMPTDDSDSEDDTLEEESNSNMDTHVYDSPGHHVHDHGYTKPMPRESPSPNGLTKSDDRAESPAVVILASNPMLSGDSEMQDKDASQSGIPNVDDDDNSSDTDSTVSDTPGVEDKNMDMDTGVSKNLAMDDSKNSADPTDKITDTERDDIPTVKDKSSDKDTAPSGSPAEVDAKREFSGKIGLEQKTIKSEPPDSVNQESHEMQCQTEEASEEESSGDEDQKPAKKVKLEKTTPVKEKDGEHSDMEDSTLTMLCETITKETFGNSCDEEIPVVEEHESDDDEEDLEEYVEIKEKKKKIKKTKPKVKSNARGFVEWKDEYGSTRDVDGDPELLKIPFKLGWKRELVIRGVYEEYSKSGQPKRKPADVYYFTPEGLKLRSKIMISSHLEDIGSDMTMANFTFIRKPIHHPPEEMVRHAGKSVGRTPGRKSTSLVKSPVTKSPSKPTSSPSTRGTKRKRGRPRIHNYSTDNVRPQPYPPKAPVCREILVLPPMENLPPPEVVIEREGEEEPYNKDSAAATTSTEPKLPSEPIHIQVSGPPIVPKKVKAVARKSTTQAAKRNNQPVQRAPSEKFVNRLPTAADQLCGLDCPGRGGQPPALQCGICMCLFHPECVNFTGIARPPLFVCRRCQKHTGDAASTKVPAAPTKIVINAPNTTSWSPVTLGTALSAGASPGMIVRNTNNNISVITAASSNPAMPALRNCLTTGGPVPTAVMSNRADHHPGAVKTFLIPVSPSGVNTPPNRAIPLQISSAGIPLLGQVAPVVVSSPPVPNTNTIANTKKPPSTINDTRPSPAPRVSVPTPPSVTSGVTATLPKLTPAPIPKAPSGSATQLGADPPQPPQLFKNGLSVFNVTKPPVSSPSPAAAGSKDEMISVSKVTVVTTSTKEPNPVGGTGDGKVEGDSKSTPAQLLTLPAAVVSRLNLTQPLALKINNVQIVAPPSCFMKSQNGVVKVCLPANTVPLLAGAASTLNMQVKVSGESPENSLKIVDFDPASAGETPSKAAKVSDVPSSSSSKKTCPSKKMTRFNSKVCHFRALWGGFEAMLEIFTHLNIKDLLRARCVCKTWRRIIQQSSLWQHVNLAGLHVKHWPTAVQFLGVVRTESLDLRCCAVLPTESTMFPYIGELDLKQLYLGEVTPSMLHQVGLNLTQLTHLSADVKVQMQSAAPSINFAKLSHLKQLRELRLYCSKKESNVEDRGESSQGTQLKAFKLAELGSLKNLEILVLPSLGSSGDWGFLAKLTKLRELELADCSPWKHSVSYPMSQCKELEVLRLAHGGTFPDTGMADALANLTKLKHLELNDWIIPHTIQDVLPELDCLQTLIITPDTTSKAEVINRNTLSAVWDLSRLKKLKWGIKHSRATIILNDGGGDDSDPTKQPTQCIPFLADDVSSDHLEQVGIEQMTQFISIEQLREKLHSLLPETEVEVYLISQQADVEATPSEDSGLSNGLGAEFSSPVKSEGEGNAGQPSKLTSDGNARLPPKLQVYGPANQASEMVAEGDANPASKMVAEGDANRASTPQDADQASKSQAIDEDDIEASGNEDDMHEPVDSEEESPMDCQS